MLGDHSSGALPPKEVSCATHVQLEGAMDRWVCMHCSHQCSMHNRVLCCIQGGTVGTVNMVMPGVWLVVVDLCLLSFAALIHLLKFLTATETHLLPDQNIFILIHQVCKQAVSVYACTQMFVCMSVCVCVCVCLCMCEREWCRICFVTSIISHSLWTVCICICCTYVHMYVCTCVHIRY